MTIAFVLGNGVSRQGIDLHQLRTHGKIYGCNALYREFTPDVLVATDRPIATAIQESGYSQSNLFYTRRPTEGLGAKSVPKAYFGYSSGPIAAAVAAENGYKCIYLLGFDMGPNNNQFNNIYAGTEFYKPNNALPTFTGNWAKQLIHIAKDFSQTEFIRVCGPTTAAIPQFDAVTNLKSLDLQIFLNQTAITVVR
jgi:hypothetical protein